MVAISFPASPSVNDTFTANGKTWQWNGTFWSLVVSGASVADGSVSTAKIADSAITAAKIADGTVVAAEIASGAITNAKLATDAVHSINIAAGAVTAAKLGNDISLTPADGSITAAKIASDAVTTAKILDLNVTTAKVAANAITQAKLASNVSGITITTTANRGTDVASPFTGQTIFLTDVKRMQVWDGSAWMFMTVGVPDAPTSLSATALSTTSVSIAFTAGSLNGSIVTNYKYALSTNGGSTYSEYAALDSADTVSPITISGLTGATTYHIKLKAVADFGDSVDSSAVSVTTLTPPGAPTSLSATTSSDTLVSIAFTAGATGGSAFTNMEYALSTNSGATYSAYAAFSPADYTTPVVVSGLTPNTEYTIKLRHVTTAGAGPDSSAVTITTLVDTQVLLIAGGGAGGGRHYAGGGGAGGARTFASIIGVTSVVIGGGGAGTGEAVKGTNGSNSSLVALGTTYSSTGGGGGGSYTTAGNAGQSGGSGGGGSLYQATYLAGSGNAGSYSPVEGYAGGVGSSYNNVATANGGGGGGGGAGGVGEAVYGNANKAGYGGIGITSTITGSSVKYAGGGGGGLWTGSRESGLYADYGGGRGGGGGSEIVTAGTANKGGGGGGAKSEATSGAGGSGVIILRYTSAANCVLGAGLTGSTATDGSFKVTTITAGSGNVSWA